MGFPRGTCAAPPETYKLPRVRGSGLRTSPTAQAGRGHRALLARWVGATFNQLEGRRGRGEDDRARPRKGGRERRDLCDAHAGRWGRGV